MTFARYVALGDSFTEGVGDWDSSRPNGVRGWADRFAEALSRSQGGALEYANLAIRGRKLGPIIAEQFTPALAMRPDLVTLYAGANDIMRPKVDLEALVATYDEAVARLTSEVGTVVLFTACDPGDTKVYAPVRPRFVRYCEAVRQTAERHGAVLVDYWRMTEFRDLRWWDEDRMHMAPAGHQHVAIAVLDALGIDHDLVEPTLPQTPRLSWGQTAAQNARWTRQHLGPWITRRVTGRSSGDGLSPRRPVPEPV